MLATEDAKTLEEMEVSLTYTSHQPQNPNSLRDTGNNTTHMVFEGELSVKLHAKEVEFGTSSDRNPGQDQVTMGRARNLGYTNE